MNKHTILLTRIDETIKYLRQYHIHFKLFKILKGIGRGINDIIAIDNEPSSKKYILRRLDFQNTIMLERAILIDNNDLDDFIVSYVFKKEEVPKEWDAIIRRSC